MIALLRGLRRAFSPGKNDPLRADAADLLRVGCTIAVAAYHIWQQSWLNPAFSLFGLRVNLRNQVATGYLGVDLLLMPSDFQSAYQAVLAACESGEIPQERIDASVTRILNVKLNMET